MNLNELRTEELRLKIGRKEYCLRFDLLAFAEASRLAIGLGTPLFYNSVIKKEGAGGGEPSATPISESGNILKEAIDFLNDRNYDAISVFFQAGLTDKKINADKLLQKIDLDLLLELMGKAISNALGSDFNFDWGFLYCIAKTALNMSEKEFWHSTPKKILSLFKKLCQLKQNNKNKHAMKEFMAW